MPYGKNETPTAVKNLPAGAQTLFKKCFNAIYADTQDENKSRMGGWACVKREYHKMSEGHWMSNSEMKK